MTSDVQVRAQRSTIRVLSAVVATLLLSACTATATTIAQVGQQPTTDTSVEASPDGGVESPPTDTGSSNADNPTDPDSDPDSEDGSEDKGEDAAPDTESTEPDQTPEAGVPDAEDSPPATGETAVVLLDAGAEPRTELRMVIAPSCGEVMTFRQSQEITQSVDGVALPSAGSIGQVMVMATSAARTGDNYDVRAEVISAEAAPGTAPEVAAAVNVELARLVGLTTVATISDRGVQIPGTTRIEGGESLGPLRETVEAFSQTQSPLPIEAVGAGARWETTGVVDVQGLMVVTTTETEVLAIEGTIVELRVMGEQSVAIGSVMNVQGVSAEVTEWTSTTTGEVTIDLATISPIRSTTVTNASQGFEFGAGAGAGNLVQSVVSQVSITGEPDDGCTGRSTQP